MLVQLKEAMTKQAAIAWETGWLECQGGTRISRRVQQQSL
jgi:hypothetical protein